MVRLYENASCDPKTNAQRNLMGRTHYVDPDTLRFHKCRIMSARPVDGGLLFAIVTSDALDYQNTRRGFRYVVFDVFGTVLSRVKLEEAYRTSAQASKAMWEYLNSIDAKAVTMAAIEKRRIEAARELDELAARVNAVKAEG
jgi:hypothetical protein